jgi:short-subunit dehydrogenase
MNSPVLIAGGTSGIGRAVAAEFARSGTPLILAARNADQLEVSAADLRIRHSVPVETLLLDLSERSAAIAAVDELLAKHPDLAGVVLCFGYMGDQTRAQTDPHEAAAIPDVTFTGCVVLLERLAAYFETQRRGFITALTSVAGDRGRKANYIYGASKAGLSTYLAGLDHRLAGSRVRVIDIKPGVVDTKMTFGMKSRPLMVSPERVARSICRISMHGNGRYYVPWFWRWIMLVIRMIPRRIFNKLNL